MLAPKLTDLLIATSKKYNTVVSLMTREALRLDLPAKLLAVAHKLLNRSRRDYIMAGTALALIIAVLFKIFAHGTTLVAPQAGQASTEPSLSTSPMSEPPAATAVAKAKAESAPVVSDPWLRSIPPIA
jgi:hypothetical protein